MKKTVYAIGIVLLLITLASSQGMMGGVQVTAEEVNQTKHDEAEGFAIWTKVQNRELSCGSLTDDQYELLGEYFMGQSAGDYHAAMNKRMQQMMGESGEEQMHISMGRQYSGCSQTTYPQGNWNTGSMMSWGVPGLMGYGMMGGAMAFGALYG